MSDDLTERDIHMMETMGEDLYDWIIEDRNREWHDVYFTRPAIRHHQAKGSCPLVWRVLEYMEEQHWLREGDVIFDPMCGIGSFLIVAAVKGYDGIGVELEDTFCQDMVGYDTIPLGEDTLFASVPGHVEGQIEKFKRVTKGWDRIGNWRVIQGDARKLQELWGTLCAKVVCSPPYGNRLRDAGQQFGSDKGRDDRKTWKELEEELEGSYNKQYSLDPNNIGNAKIKVVSSPPYSRTTEHSKSQIDYLPEVKRPGHKGFEYANKKNVALLKDSAYSKEMLKVYRSLYSVLAPGAYVALITRNFIQKRKVVMLDELTIRLMERAGFGYLETKRAQLPDVSFFKNSNYLKYHKKWGLPLIDWEEISFFKKVR